MFQVDEKNKTMLRSIHKPKRIPTCMWWLYNTQQSDLKMCEIKVMFTFTHYIIN